MSLDGGSQPGFPQSVWQGAAQGMAQPQGPPPQHAPYPSALAGEIGWSGALLDRARQHVAREGHSPSRYARGVVSTLAVGGVVVLAGAVATESGLRGLPRIGSMAGAGVVSALAFRPRRDPGFEPDWLLSTGSPVRDCVRVVAALGAVLAGVGYGAQKVEKLFSWRRKDRD